MKKLFLMMSAILLTSFMVFISCKHDIKNKEGEEKPKDLPTLTLETLTIHGVPVTEKKVTLEQEQIVAENIEAHFSYGSVSDEKITVVVKDSPFVLDKTKSKTLHINVPAKEDTYKTWDEDIEVSWQKGKETATNLITGINIAGLHDNGVAFVASREQIQKLLSDKDFVLEMKGPNALVLVGSKDIVWTKCVIDGKEVPFQPYPSFKFKSGVYVSLELGKIDSITEHKILVETDDKKQEIPFKIKRLSGTVDIPNLKLIVVASDVITNENLPKLFDGSRPSFNGTDPCHIEVRCAKEDVETCIIDGSSPINMTKKTISSQEVYCAESSVVGAEPSGKDVDVVVKPKNQIDYHDTVWKFHLNYQAKTQMNVIYSFNNKARRHLDPQFVKDLEEGKKPTLALSNASFLNIKLQITAKLSEIKINDTSFTGATLIEEGVRTIFTHSFPITTTEQDIKIVLIPKDTGKHYEKVLEFEVKGDGNKEKLNPTLSINETNKFSDEFMADLTNGNKPLHKIFNSPANIEISVDEYAYTFLSNTIKINGDIVQIKEEKKGYKKVYLAKKSIDVLDTEAKDIKVEFMPKTAGIFAPLTWEFKLQSGAEKPVFPKEEISLFAINEVGAYGKDPLPKELLDNLTTETPYTYIIDENKALIQVGWYKNTNDKIKHTIFEVDGTATTIIAEQNANAYICSHTLPLPDLAEHEVKIKIVPKENINYKELVYSFKIKKSGLLPKLPLKFWMEEGRVFGGEQIEIKTDMPIISVTSEEDNDEEVMNEVTMNGTKVEIEKKKAANGNGYFFEAMKTIDISTTEYTDIIISVTPKDSSKYRITECKFKLKSKVEMPKNNAKFLFDSNEEQIVEYNIEWVNAEKREAKDDHGAKSVVLTFFTESTHTKVKYKKMFVAEDRNGNYVFQGDLSDYEEAKHFGTKHITKKIELAQDKPCTIKAEVISDDGTKDPDKGVYYFTFNPVLLLWSYYNGTELDSYENLVRDLEDVSGVKTPVIKINKTEVQNGKLYLILSAWNEEAGCNVSTGGAIEFVKFKREDDLQWYKAQVDVSSLNTQTDVIDVSFPLLFNGKPSFTYKFKIKLQ